MTESFADNARCHTETLESVEGEPVCELLTYEISIYSHTFTLLLASKTECD